MNLVTSFPLFSIILCLLSSVITSVLPEKAARVWSLALCGVCAALAGSVLAMGAAAGVNTTYMMGHYPHPWGNEIRFGILEPLMACVFAAVMLFCLLGGRVQLKHDLQDGKRNLYYVLADLALASLTAMAYTNDLFTGYVFIEITTLASCGLLMIRQMGRTTLASIRYMIFSLLGSGLFLMGVILLYGITGHLLMPNLKESVAALWESGAYRTPLITSMCLITVGIAIKSGLFPFHFWMPDTYGYATASSGGILSGIISKGYIFLLIKIIYGVFGREVFDAGGVSDILYLFGLCGIVIGSVSAMREKDILRMTAFSSAAQIGYVYMGIGLSPELGMLAAVYHILTHAATKPLLFLSAAQLKDTAGGADFHTLTGAAHRNRTAGAAFTVGAFSMIGIPLTMGFVSKYRFAEAAFDVRSRLIATLIVLAVSTVLNTFYFARTVVRLYSPAREDMPRVRFRENLSFDAAAICMALFNLFCGIASEPLLDLLRRGLELL